MACRDKRDSERRGRERYLVCICENCKMLSDHINTLEVKLPKQFMAVIKPKVIKFSTQYPDNVTQEGSIWEVSWSSLGRPGASWELAANITQTLLKFKILKLTNIKIIMQANYLFYLTSYRPWAMTTIGARGLSLPWQRSSFLILVRIYWILIKSCAC